MSSMMGRALGLLRTRLARPLFHRVRRPYVLFRIARASEVRLLGHRFRTDPDVFHPLYFSSSSILATHLLELPLSGLRVLDMGTGTGVLAVAVAARGASVTACDINPRAVALAAENARINGVETEVVESDLFSALSGKRFDLICFNIPFYARAPKSHLEAAYFAGANLDTVSRFAAGVRRHLEPRGRIIIIFSEDCDGERIRHAFRETGLSLEETQVTRKLFEDFHVACFRSTNDLDA